MPFLKSYAYTLMQSYSSTDQAAFFYQRRLDTRQSDNTHEYTRMPGMRTLTSKASLQQACSTVSKFLSVANAWDQWQFEDSTKGV